MKRAFRVDRVSARFVSDENKQGSAACVMARNVEALAAFPVVQAAGAALMTPTSLGLLLASFWAEKRAGAVRT